MYGAALPLVPVVVESKIFRVALSSKTVPTSMPKLLGGAKPNTPRAAPPGSPWLVMAGPVPGGNCS